MLKSRLARRAFVFAVALATLAVPAYAQTSPDISNQDGASGNDVSALKKMVTEQQKQIEKLTRTVELLSRRLDGTSQPISGETAHSLSVGQVSSLAPVIPTSVNGGQPGLTVMSAPGTPPASAAQMEDYTKKVDALGKTVDTINTGGFLWLSEYNGDYHPNKNLSFRAGKMEEVFADNQKFMFDDDVRLNGAQEIAKAKLGNHASVEFRAGQYIFTNPNVQVLPSAASCAGATPPATCVFEKAGYPPGGKVRDSNLYHQGIVLNAQSGENWKHKFTADFQDFRNPNQFLIASSLASGVPVLVNGYTGLTLSGGVGQLGNGTTTAGGFNYTASDYHVGRIGYMIEYGGWKTSRESWPLSLDIQVARNFGGSFLNNAEFAQVSFGSVKKAGDLR